MNTKLLSDLTQLPSRLSDFFTMHKLLYEVYLDSVHDKRKLSILKEFHCYQYDSLVFLYLGSSLNLYYFFLYPLDKKTNPKLVQVSRKDVADQILLTHLHNCESDITSSMINIFIDFYSGNRFV